MSMPLSHRWQFPLPRTHTGILQGNGVMGSMIWGEKNIIKITFNRADFWDHRGGLPWKDEISYSAIRTLLENRDSKGIEELFSTPPQVQGQPSRPSILPLGRLEFEFPVDHCIDTGLLNMRSGEVELTFTRPSAADYKIQILMAMDKPVLHVQFGQVPYKPKIKCVSAHEHIGEQLEKIGIPKPHFFEEGSFGGWIQERPVDPPICVGYENAHSELWVNLSYGDGIAEAKTAAKKSLGQAMKDGLEKLRDDGNAWWNSYWLSIPSLSIPNERLRFVYHYGMYKFAGLTHPDGIPATLQGPWAEEYQMPPWSCDYHFNINVQMCYWPAYRSGRLEHLKPLFKMISGWKNKLADNARKFVGIEDGLIMPHAVDDRAMGMGGFWTGAIDHGCTAWIADMMWQYVSYSGDREFLEQECYPFLVGTMRVYEQMLEENAGFYHLPVSVSPEYRGAEPNAWGANASFQLAAIHRLIEDLLQACRMLGKTPRDLWYRIQKGLPRATLIGAEKNSRIALWENTDLEESHRHHSHLAGLHPFGIIDSEDPAWKEILRRTYKHWVYKGMGLWSGWCVPWASMINTHMGNADAAELLLEMWEKLFTNEGHGTLHDPNFPGITNLGSKFIASNEIMQMDAGMGATAAILEMMVCTRGGVDRIFPGAPTKWRDAEFRNVKTAGGFLIGAKRVKGSLASVTVQACFSGVWKVKNPFGTKVKICKGPNFSHCQYLSDDIIEIGLQAGERAELTIASS